MQASRLIARVRRTLIDEGSVTWSDPDLLDYLTAAERYVCSVKPDEYTTIAPLVLAPGVDQVLPDDALSLFEVLRNANGRAVNMVGKDLLDNTNPMWAANTPQPVILEYMADHRDPKRFYVNPPSDGTAQVIVFYAVVPPELNALTDDLVVGDTLGNALWAYTIGLAYAENTKRQDLQKSAGWISAAKEMIGVREVVQQKVAPELGLAERV